MGEKDFAGSCRILDMCSVIILQTGSVTGRRGSDSSCNLRLEMPLRPKMLDDIAIISCYSVSCCVAKNSRQNKRIWVCSSLTWTHFHHDVVCHQNDKFDGATLVNYNAAT